MATTLFERLGGTQTITQIASDIVDLHNANPRIATRFADSDTATIKDRVATFFITGTGGPAVYQGKDMLAAHKGMNIDSSEFIAVVDDALEALRKNGIEQREMEEVLFILYSMKSDVVLV